MHYGKYASLYLKNTFFFDANPPLGKLLIAFAGYLSGFDGGNFGFDKIGTSYPEDIPHVVLRMVPAIFGALLTPTVFLILTELHAFAYAGYLASFMVVFGNDAVKKPYFFQPCYSRLENLKFALNEYVSQNSLKWSLCDSYKCHQKLV